MEAWTIHPRFVVEGELGSGAMGVVLRARDQVLDRPVALKLPRHTPPLDTPEFRERFLAEARAAARVEHDHVVRIYDSGDYEGQLFLVMQLLQGRTLHAIISAGRALTVATRLRWLAELCDAVDAVHRAGIVHRDIKPANLMVVGDHETLKLLDFGVAKLTGPGPASLVAGTPQYMSPEQITGGALDYRSDVFAIGVVAYELLTFRALRSTNGDLWPFVRGTLRPAPMTEVPSDVRAEVEHIVCRCLATRADDRFATPREPGALLRALARSVDVEETTVRAQVRNDREPAPDIAPTHVSPEVTEIARPVPEAAAPSRSRLIIASLVAGAAAIGATWALIGGSGSVHDAPAEAPPQMVRIETDVSAQSAELPPAFLLDVTEVTNAEFRRFVTARPEWRKGRVDVSTHDGDYLKLWRGETFPAALEHHPVVYVSWYAAQAYAEWAGKRLPTLAEWRYACRARTRTRYWWGDAFVATRATQGTSGTESVGAPEHRNPFGLADMSGNVWEWSATADNVEARRRVAAGGSWRDGPSYLESDARALLRPEQTGPDLGFRCAKSAETNSP
jgi:eukaryotic-like serine/threonine-protein kinase